MLFQVERPKEPVAIVSLVGPLLHFSDLASLPDLLKKLARSGTHATVLDFAQVGRATYAGIAGFLDLLAQDTATRLIACSVPEKMIKHFERTGMNHTLPLARNRVEAFRRPEINALKLAHTKAVVLCAGHGSRIAPLSSISPKPMLDVVGQPILAHILDHLERHGIRDVYLNPGHLGHQIHDYFHENRRRDQSLFFVNEGKSVNGSWSASPIGSASTLRNLRHAHSAFDGDLLVLCGDALIDLDLSELMDVHRSSGADLTIAAAEVNASDVHRYGIIQHTKFGRVTGFQEKPKRSYAKSRVANTGIYVLKPHVLDLLPATRNLDIALDLLPRLLSSGAKVYIHAPKFTWLDVGCCSDYARAISKVLFGHIPFITPNGVEHRPGLFAAESARVSKQSNIAGPLYIGEEAEILGGARLIGPTAIGFGSLIESRTVVRDSIVLPHTRICAGALVDGQITHPNWSLTHKWAEAAPTNLLPAENVTNVNEETFEAQLMSA